LEQQAVTIYNEIQTKSNTNNNNFWNSLDHNDEAEDVPLEE
jgi:hypothetical protein